MIIAVASNNKMTDNNLDLELYWIINPYRCVAINETALINRTGIMIKDTNTIGIDRFLFHRT